MARAASVSTGWFSARSVSCSKWGFAGFGRSVGRRDSEMVEAVRHMAGLRLIYLAVQKKQPGNQGINGVGRRRSGLRCYNPANPDLGSVDTIFRRGRDYFHQNT